MYSIIHSCLPRFACKRIRGFAQGASTLHPDRRICLSAQVAMAQLGLDAIATKILAAYNTQVSNRRERPQHVQLGASLVEVRFRDA